MTRQQITTKLIENHEAYVNFMNSLSDEDFEFVPVDRWSAGQQLRHIFLSIKPLVQVLMLPNFMLKILFGKANRNGRNYDELVARYNEKLQKGGRASGRFVPAPTTIAQRNALGAEVLKLIGSLNKQINKYSDSELDQLILPHPLLGKLTLREMFYFTIYHVQHHLEITKRNLLSRKIN